MRSTRLAALLVAGALISSCGGSDGGPSGPTAGVLSLTLNTPNTGDGAVLFRVNGGVVDSFAGSPMVLDGNYNTFTGNLTRVVVAGPITDGIIGYLFVPDVSKVGNYTITMEQVVANSNFAQRPVVGYSFAVTVAP